MKLKDTVLYKGKPAYIFGSKKVDGKLTHWCILILNGRAKASLQVGDFLAGIWVSINSKHLKEM